ncbi:MAG TPA: hypothetical protein VGI72_05315 [Gaiellales bacterium]
MGINDQSLDPAGVRGFDWSHALRRLGAKDGDGRWRWPHRPDGLRRATDLVLFLSLVLGIALSAVFFAPAEEEMIFKIVAVVFFALLPALIYLQFVSERIHAVWDEYVINLYQLSIDDPANLPEPPAYSEYHAQWVAGRREQAGRGGGETTGEGRRTLYQLKFEGLFGQVDRDRRSRLRSQNAMPVAVTTFIMAIGWVFVASPESIWNRSLGVPAAFVPSGLPPFPMETVRFAFLGAYFYILQMIVRRYFQGDLKPNAYLHATMRVIMSVLLVWTIDPLMADRSQAQRSAVAFVIGVFPMAGWQLLTSLIAKPARWVLPSLKPDHPLDGIEGLNVWYQSRLLELGIEDMQNLAHASFVELMLNTRIPIGRLVDWVDQAILMLHIDGKHRLAPSGATDLATLRRYGIRNATSFEEALGHDAVGGQKGETGGDLDNLLNAAGEPSVVNVIDRAMRRERNLKFVRAWKYYGQGGLKPA